MDTRRFPDQDLIKKIAKDNAGDDRYEFIHRFCSDFISETGFAPMIREIGNAMMYAGLTSKPASKAIVSLYLDKLEEDSLLEFQRSEGHAMRVPGRMIVHEATS